MTGFLDGAVIESSSGVDTGDIPASLRFRGAQYLSKTITTDATSTYFAAVKRGKLGVISPIFDTNIKFNANDTLTAFGLTTTAVFRDPTSWLFIHVSNGGLYINGVSFGAVTTSALTNPRIGFDGTNYFDGYIARIGCVAGSSSAYTNFGYLNTTINEWVSLSQSAVKAVVDAGGTNSFMLDFDDATSLTTLGYDLSTKGNDWALNNFSLTAGTTYDHMLDVPGNSYATLNPLFGATAAYRALSNANLSVSFPSGVSLGNAFASLALTSSNKFCWEVQFSNAGGGAFALAGIVLSTVEPTTAQIVGAGYKEYLYNKNGNKYIDGTSSAYGASFTTEVLRFEWDSGSLTCFKGGVSQGVLVSGLTGTYYPYIAGYSSAAATIMFGQAPLHSSAAYRSGAGGYFVDAPTTGFKSLCQANLPDVSATLLDPTDHHIDITVTKSGDTNFTLPWDASVYDTFFEIKRRDAAGDWYQIDGLRGYTKILKSNSTAAETTDANVLGISGTTGTLKSTLADGTYIVSATKAGLSASRQTNTDGSITSTVSRNVDSGFSIVSCTGTAANATVGHGLGVALNQIVAKALGSATEWPVYHSKLANTEYLVLNTTAAKATGATYWNSTSPTSTVFSLGSSTNTNNTGGMIFYCYADSEIQKSFSYTGNASTDGAYADVGFKMGRALLKCSSTTGNWTVLDSERSTSNVADDVIYENLTNAEATSALADLNSRSIKFRITTDPNSAQTFIGHAWAAMNGKYSNSR